MGVANPLVKPSPFSNLNSQFPPPWKLVAHLPFAPYNDPCTPIIGQQPPCPVRFLLSTLLPFRPIHICPNQEESDPARLKLIPIFSALLILGLILGACATPPPTVAPAGDAGEAVAPAAAESVTLTWALWGSPEEVVSHQRVAAPHRRRQRS